MVLLLLDWNHTYARMCWIENRTSPCFRDQGSGIRGRSSRNKERHAESEKLKQRRIRQADDPGSVGGKNNNLPILRVAGNSACRFRSEKLILPQNPYPRVTIELLI